MNSKPTENSLLHKTYVNELDIYFCKLCTNFLIPPIQLVEGVGNICGQCNFSDEKEVKVHNDALESILRNLVIACPNCIIGCTHKINYSEVSQHMTTCLSRKYKCPFRFKTDCSWEDGISGFIKHSESDHAELISKQTENVFDLQVDVLASSSVVRILRMDNETFILHIKWNMKKSTLQCLLYYIGNVDKATEFLYSVKQMIYIGTKKYILKHSSNNTTYDTSISVDFDEERALTVDLSSIQAISHSNYATILIKITEEKAQSEEFDQSLLLYFQCIYCDSPVTTPIYYCEFYHTLCKYCRVHKQVCVKCNESVRNYALEKMGGLVKFPCVFVGCNVLLSLDSIDNHTEQICKLKLYDCPFPKCFGEENYFNIATHLQEKHKEQCKFTKYYEKFPSRFSLVNKKIDILCVVINKDVFRVMFKSNSKSASCSVTLAYIGPDEDAKKYGFELELVNKRNKNKKLINIDECQSLSESNEDLSGLTLPQEIMAKFSSPDLIFANITIYPIIPSFSKLTN